MSFYWLACAALGLKTGYFELLLGLEKDDLSPRSLPSSPLFFVAAVVATLAPQPFYFAAVSERAERNRPGPRDWPAIVAFAVVNSVLETAVFKAAVDFGLALLPESKQRRTTTFLSFFNVRPPPPLPPTLLQALVSFTTLSCYCGIVHALFWDKFAFPPHRPPPASEVEREDGGRSGGREASVENLKRRRTAMDRALALFFPMTAAWHGLLLKSSLGPSPSAALAAVVALHAVADLAAAFSLRLRGPRGRREGGEGGEGERRPRP